MRPLARAPIASFPEQRRFWNQWNATARIQPQSDEPRLDEASRRRAEQVERWLSALELRNPAILEVGCGTGWLAGRLAVTGRVTGVDLADEVLELARRRYPAVEFLAGDIAQVGLPLAGYDVVVTLETAAHVVDQRAFVARLAALLRPGGYLMLTTQNRLVFERREDIGPPGAGQLRRWLGRRDLSRLLRPHVRILRLTTLLPAGHGGFLRLVNSYKLNGAAERILARRSLERLKEAAGLGQTIAVLARKPAS